MIDPVTLAVIDARLLAIVDEMGEALLRAAYSQILNSSRDFSIAICDSRGDLVSQADHMPVHVGAMPYAARAVIADFGDTASEGDIYVLNDPWHGGSHLPDLTLIQPVYDEQGALRFWCVVRAHQSDIGGNTHGAYNAEATEIWQEGLRIPPIRLGENGGVRADLVKMLAANTRLPKDFRGDLMAAVGAAKLGEERLRALFSRYTGSVVSEAGDQMIQLAEKLARETVKSWADGSWLGEAVLDDDGHGAENVTIRARVTKSGSSITVDLTESDPQVKGFVNASYATMRSGVAIAFAYLLSPDIPKNEGVFRVVDVIARQGTVVWAAEGAAVTLSTSHCCQEIIEAVVKALSNACPDRAMAGWGRRFRIALAGRDPRTGNKFMWHLFHARPGAGAFPGGDGWHSIGEWQSAGGGKFGSIEVAETRFPLFFARHELRPDSGGDGQYRGGNGSIVEIRLEADGDTMANTAGDGIRHGAAGLLGGKDGATHHYVLKNPGERVRDIKTKESGITLKPGAVLELESGGGGGWGDPNKRNPASRATDKLEGYIG